MSKSYSDSDEWTGWASDLDDDSGRRKGPLSIAVWSVLVERGGEMLGVIECVPVSHDLARPSVN